MTRIVRVVFLEEPTLPREIAQGSVIAGRYEVLACLGAGGMGTVFKARDRLLGETVALKVAREGRLEERLLERMRAEVKLARSIRHPNVCAVHDYGEDGATVFLSMQYVAGRDLRAVLDDRGSLSWEEAYGVVTQVAEGLVAIHDAGIIHRDLKPSNVMVDERGLVRVVDFGVALWRTESEIVGTGAPGYMSPEQIRGHPLDFRSDIYCFGCLIYEAFTASPPFWADTPMAVMLKHLEEPPPLEGAAAVQLPRSLLPVLSRALAKEPSGRSQTAARCMRR
jgi:serine/threonine-protein kinase